MSFQQGCATIEGSRCITYHYDLLGRKRDDGIAVLVFHALLPSQKDVREDDLDGFKSLRILVLEWDRHERVEERPVAPWSVGVTSQLSDSTSSRRCLTAPTRSE